MTLGIDDWTRVNSERVIARHNAKLDNLKLLVTFTLGIAATLVATALQVGDQPSIADFVAVGLLAISFALTVWSLLQDRSKTPDRFAAFAEMDLRGWYGQLREDYLNWLNDAAELINGEVVLRVQATSRWQVAATLATSIAATTSLLI